LEKITQKEISKTEVWKLISKVCSRAVTPSDSAVGFQVTAIYTFDLDTTNSTSTR